MKRNIKCVFVSNNIYGSGITNLKGANQITSKLHKFFLDTICAKKEDALLLQDETHTETIDKILGFISENSEGLKQGDILLFYFCGHGYPTSEFFNELMLESKDTNSKNRGMVGVKFKDICNKVNELGIKNFIAIVDSCYSGNINKENRNPMGIIKNEGIIFNNDYIDDGTVFISSSKGSSLSYEIEINGNIVPCFSYYFLESLKSFENETDIFSINNVFERTKKSVMGIKNINMVPQISSQNSLSNSPIFKPIWKQGVDVMKNSIIDIVDWRITSSCNNNCGVCYAANSCKSLDRASVKIVIDKLKLINCKTVCVTGGEATLNNDFEYIIKQLYSNEFSIFLSTNGHNFSKHRELYESHLEKLSLPLDGFDDESNRCNGRNIGSFDEVIKILDEYKERKPKFKIKISTVITAQNCSVNHFNKMLRLLKNYDNISIWKLYEFVPESRGKENKQKFTTKASNLNSLHKKITEVKNDVGFHIELISRRKRNSAYFIIQPNGDVIIPKEGNEDIVIEENIGNIVSDDIKTIMSKWNAGVDENNYIQNMKFRDVDKPYILSVNEKNILNYIMSQTTLPSIKLLSQELKIDENIVSDTIDDLYRKRVIKNVIPMINLKQYEIETFLVTLYFANKSLYPDGYYIDYLYNNAHIGWITECENRIIRIALFAKDQTHATDIVEDIKKDLKGELIKSEIGVHKSEITIGERNLFSSDSDMPYINEIGEKTLRENLYLTRTEFDILHQLEKIRKPIAENLNEKLLLEKELDANIILNNLKERKVINQLYTILDTRMLGYEWYIIFVNNPTSDDARNMREYLINNFKNITHINSFVDLKSEIDMDFEVHVSSYVEIDNMIEKLNKEFPDSEIETPLKIRKEHKYSFFTHYVFDKIYKDYLIKE